MQINSQYKPIVKAQPGEYVRLRFVNTLPEDSLYYGLPADVAESCDMAVLAFDGVYLDEPRPTTQVFIAPGI